MIDTTLSAATNGDDSLRSKVYADIATRQVWLDRQAVWYQMRHDGLRRKNKPWPNASDLHYPLADSIIERLKPFYFNQLFATETMAQFVATDPALNATSSDLSYWFDYKLKQESNIENEILIAIDMMLMAGMDVVEVLWCSKKKQLIFDAIDPSCVIVPEWTKTLQDADRVTIVKTLSKEQYKRDPRFPNKDKDFISRISGRGTEDGENTTLDNIKTRREGITFSTSPDTIVYWEVWEQEADGWYISYISPNDPEELRPRMKNPFLHAKLPMVRFAVEEKGKGYYEPRGICERIGSFESATTKQWNEKTDYMTLCNRPLFTSANPIPNGGNMKIVPGSYIPGDMKAVQMPPPPVSFDEEMQAQRAAAEQLIGMPDFGLGENNQMQDSRTATEVNKIATLTTISVDLKARTFRNSTGELYNLAFATLLQYDEGGGYIFESEMRKLPPGVIDQLKENPDGIRIQPNGSGDSWNKQAQMQKAVARKQLFAQSPWINQPELDKSILELDDPRLVARLFLDPGVKQQQEYVAESLEIPTLLLGFPIPVLPQQDHAARIKCLSEFMQQRAKIGAAPDPMQMASVSAHLQEHAKALKAQNPELFAQVMQELQMKSAPQPSGNPGQLPQGQPTLTQSSIS